MKGSRENQLATRDHTPPLEPGAAVRVALDAPCAPAPDLRKPSLRQSASAAPSRDTAVWPALSSLSLSLAAIAERVGSIGGSDANTILSGSGERILRVWREKRGQEVPEDLSNKLPVMFGSWTEAFNRQWYEKLVGHAVTRVGERLHCPVRSCRSATLDGFVEARGAVWEARHTSPFVKPGELLQRYMPQLQHTMALAGCGEALLSGSWHSAIRAKSWKSGFARWPASC